MRIKNVFWDTAIVYVDGKISSTYKDCFVELDKYTATITNSGTDRSVSFIEPSIIFICRDRIEFSAVEKFFSENKQEERKVIIKATL